MEIKSSIVDKWKYFTLGTILGFFIFFLNSNHVHQNIYLLATKKPMVDLAPNEVLNLTKIAINPSNIIINDTTKVKNNNTIIKRCNIFDGRWVYKPNESISYNLSSCPFIMEKMSCQDNGRRDSEYEKWRWEARDCDLPLFNGRDMVERLRNKRMIIVGDSINHNMWQSLVCLLMNSVPTFTSKVDKPKGYKWKAEEYNFTLEFFWSPFLVEINNNHESGKNVLVLDKLSSDSERWKGADIMVFNSGHWWGQSKKSRRWDLLEYKGKLIQDMPNELVYEHGLKTWASWIEENVDPNKTMVFFKSYSPVHKFAQHDQSCYNKTQPIMDNSYVPDFPKSMFDVVHAVLKRMNNRVRYLNITKLSEYRIDAHPSIYTTRKFEMTNLKYADCSHWCIPGVPDTWNRLLYASIFYDTLASTPTS